MKDILTGGCGSLAPSFSSSFRSKLKLNSKRLPLPRGRRVSPQNQYTIIQNRISRMYQVLPTYSTALDGATTVGLELYLGDQLRRLWRSFAALGSQKLNHASCPLQCLS